MKVGRRNGLEFSWSQIVPAGNKYETPGRIRFQLYNGGWFEAAVIHKKWALEKAVWKTPLPRTETPQWYRDVPVVFAMRGYSEKTAKANYRWFQYLQKYLDVPVYVTWMHWFQLDSLTWPEYAERPYVRAIFQDMIRNGNYIEPYLNGRLWGMEDHVKTKANRQWLKYGKMYAVKNIDGSISTENRYAVMCPAARDWQKKLMNMVKQIRPFASAAYFDQITAGYGMGCSDSSHGHKLNDPSVWISKGYRPALKQIRKEYPGLPLSSEDAAEAYMDLFDGGHVWRWSFNGMVPAFQAVYGGRMQYYGLLYDKTGKGSMESNFVKTAMSLVNGLKISRTGVEELYPADANRLFFKKMVHLRIALSKYFNEGEMQPPIRYKEPIPKHTVRASVPSDSELLTVAVVQSNTYLLGNSQIYIFVNTSSKPISFHPILPQVFVCSEDKNAPRKFDGNITLKGYQCVVCTQNAAEAKRIHAAFRKISSFTPGISYQEFKNNNQ